MRKLFILLCIIALLNCFSVLGDTIIINSKDWKDVYSGMQYGYMTGQDPKFLVSEKHANLILNEIEPGASIQAFSSDERPFVIGYESILEGEGYPAEETVFDTLSIELARDMPDINSYIIVDDSYGYNAIAVAPYAMVSGSYVLFADRENIAEVDRFLSGRNTEDILIYGHIDREVRERLDKYSPEIINQDGDRFANNVEIVKKYKELKKARQVLLSNGEFIEAEIMSGNQPVLFIGVQNVPDKIREYIKNSDIEVGVLIGNELVGTATVVRRQTGISTFVKFARSARNPQGPVSQVEGLDIFAVPTIPVKLSLESIRYNALTRQLEVTIRNDEEVAAYFKGTYTITSGGQEQTVGDIDSVFIESEDIKTVVYDLDPIVGEEVINVRYYIVYGESKNSLEKVLEGETQAERVEIEDDASITIEKLVYNKPKEKFFVYLKNIGPVDAYVDTEVIDILILDERQNFGSKEIVHLPVGKAAKSTIEAELTEEDLRDNEVIRTRAYYGEREDALIKIIEGEFELVIEEFDIWTYVPIAIIIILIILLILAIRKKKKKDKGH